MVTFIFEEIPIPLLLEKFLDKGLNLAGWYHENNLHTNIADFELLRCLPRTAPFFDFVLHLKLFILNLLHWQVVFAVMLPEQKTVKIPHSETAPL